MVENCKVNTQKLITILCASDEQVKFKIKNTTTFILALKRYEILKC